MNQNTTPATLVTPVASSASPEYFRALLESYRAELAPYEEEELLTEEQMIRPIVLLDLIKRAEEKLAEAIAAEEAAVADAKEAADKKESDAEASKEKAKMAFEQMRQDAANALAQRGEGAVAAALCGDGHPVWGKAVLEAFLARFPKGKRSTYHDVVVGTIAEAEAAIAQEANKEADAERNRQGRKK